MGLFSSLFDPAGITTGNSGEGLHNLFDPGGGILDTLGVDTGFIGDWRDQASDYMDNQMDFEGSQLDDWGKKFRKNPEQLFLGAGDPLSTKMWNGVLGTNYTPYVNTYGGPTNEAYQSAENKGIDTSNAAGSHAMAQAVASYFGGQGLGKLAGAAAGAAGEGYAAGSALEAGASGTEALAAADSWGSAANALGAGMAAGGASGGAGALNNNTDFWSGVGGGALSGALGSGFDYGGAVGLENPAYKKMFNSTLTGGLQSAATGGDFGKGAGKGLAGSAAPLLVNKGGGMLGDMFSSNDQEYDPTAGGNFGGTATANPGQTGYSDKAFLGANNNQGMDTFSALGGIASGGSAPANVQGPSSSPVQDFINSFVGGGSSGNSNAGGYGGLASNVMGLYQANEQRKKMKEQANALNNLFTPNSPYAQQMRQTMERRDAAAGRRSQYGPREAQMMAALADRQAQMAPQQMAMQNAVSENQRRMINNGLQGLGRMYQQAPQMQQDWGSLMNMFGGR